MLIKGKTLKGYKLDSRDGDIGRGNFFFRYNLMNGTWIV